MYVSAPNADRPTADAVHVLLRVTRDVLDPLLSCFPHVGAGDLERWV